MNATASQQTEKRLTSRLDQYWLSMCKDGNLPPFETFNSGAIEDVWGQCVLFVVNKSTADRKSYTFYKVGDKVKALYGGDDLTGNTVMAGQKMFKGAAIIQRMDELIKTPMPIYDSGQFVNHNHKVVKFRSCMMPFGKEKHVTHVIVGLSWREFG